MSDQIPEKLRSGLGSASYVEYQDLDDMTKRLISMVVVMTKQASELAYQLAVHNNKPTVEGDDVNSALKYQARNFLQTLDDPAIVAEVVDMEQELFAVESDDNHDDDDHTDHDDETFDETIRSSAVMSGNMCICNTCEDIRHSVDTWDDWQPEDQAELFLRHSVERAISNYESAHKELA